MCTAITNHTKDHYFGRNLDYEVSFGERVVTTPRNYVWKYKCASAPKCKYAMIGMALVEDGYPLYFDAMNEKGLAMAGLHFVGNAFYENATGDKNGGNEHDVAPYELIPLVLSQCNSVEQAREILSKVRLVAISFNDRLALSPLHFMIADKKDSIVVEPVKEGLKVYENPIGVMTNNPPFPYHLANLNNYMNVTPYVPQNRFSAEFPLEIYSRGMGAIGLPGDFSSMSRFVRAAFVRANSVSGNTEAESVSQFFHILGSVEQIRGCVRLENDMYEITTYSCCCNLDKCIYYYRTYDDSRVRFIDMNDVDLEGRNPVVSEAVNERCVTF